MLQLILFCLFLTALFAYLNARFFKLPETIAVMALALLASGVMLVLENLEPVGLMQWAGEWTGGSRLQHVRELLHSIDFSAVLMNGLLCFLLFAGAMDVKLSSLQHYKWPVLILSVLGTLITTVVVGLATFVVLHWLGIAFPLVYCLLFGALISPTDPIAVMAILRSANAPDSLGMVISGESLFNDGVGVVIFTLLLGVALTGDMPDAAEGLHLVVTEVGGGLLLGVLLGLLMCYLLRSVDDPTVEVLITLVGVLGGYQLAMAYHLSGPLAMVAAGMAVGNYGRTAMTRNERRHMDIFWELVDKILNDALFVLLGVQLLFIVFDWQALAAGVAAVVIALAARVLVAGMPVYLFRRFFMLPEGGWKVLVWGGLRGGISVALALSLPDGSEKDLILMLTYCVVVFSILVQGLTVKRMIGRVLR